MACARTSNNKKLPTHQLLPCLAKRNRAAVPSLVPGMRPSCLACDAPAWRTMLVLQELFDGWQLQAFRHWPAHATLALRAKRDALGAKAMHAWMRSLQLARGLGWARHRPAMIQDYIARGDWPLVQGLDLRSAVGYRANHLARLALHAFILKRRESWVTWIRWVRLVNGLGWARPRFARLDLDVAKFDLHVMQDLYLRSEHCPAHCKVQPS